MNRSAIPAHWSPEQALAVYDALQQLREQLWFAYRDDFSELLGYPAVEFIKPASFRPLSPQHDLFDTPGHDDGDDLPF